MKNRTGNPQPSPTSSPWLRASEIRAKNGALAADSHIRAACFAMVLCVFFFPSSLHPTAALDLTFLVGQPKRESEERERDSRTLTLPPSPSPADDTDKHRHPATVNIRNAKTGEVKTVHPDVSQSRSSSWLSGSLTLAAPTSKSIPPPSSPFLTQARIWQVSNMVWGKGDDDHQPLADIPPMVKSVSGVPRVMQQGGQEAMRGREDWYNSKVEEMRQVRDKLRAARRLAAESEQRASKGAQGAGAFGRKGMVQTQVQPSKVRRNHPPPDRPQPRPSTAGRKKGPQTGACMCVLCVSACTTSPSFTLTLQRNRCLPHSGPLLRATPLQTDCGTRRTLTGESTATLHRSSHSGAVSTGSDLQQVLVPTHLFRLRRCAAPLSRFGVLMALDFLPEAGCKVLTALHLARFCRGCAGEQVPREAAVERASEGSVRQGAGDRAGTI